MIKKTFVTIIDVALMRFIATSNLAFFKEKKKINWITLLDVNFNKITSGLHFFLISPILAKFPKDQRLIPNACEIFKRSKINRYITNQLFKFQVF